jgi:hypothetical protein
MNHLINNTTIPTITEIMALESTCSQEEKQAMMRRIELHKDEHEYLDGAWLFLQDHNNDFTALKKFLSSTTVLNHAKTNKHARTLKYAGAAAILLVLILGKLSYNKWIYQTTLKEFVFTDNSIAVFATSTNDALQKDALINAYKTENTKQGIEIFEKLDSNNYTDTLSYIAGLLYLNNKEYSKSIAQFKRIHTTSMYRNKAMYFMSIDLIYLNKKEEAKVMLRSIQTEDDEYLSAKTSSLLNEVLIWK